jgi:hypothetical protein
MRPVCPAHFHEKNHLRSREDVVRLMHPLIPISEPCWQEFGRRTIVYKRVEAAMSGIAASPRSEGGSGV